jgi:hypothetical protein
MITIVLGLTFGLVAGFSATVGPGHFMTYYGVAFFLTGCLSLINTIEIKTRLVLVFFSTFFGFAFGPIVINYLLSLF